MMLAEIDAAIKRLTALIGDIERFDPAAVTDRWGPEVSALKAAIDGALSDVFGHRSNDYRRYAVAMEIDRAPLTARREGTPLPELRAGFQSGKARSLAIIRQAIATLEDRRRLHPQIAAEKSEGLATRRNDHLPGAL